MRSLEIKGGTHDIAFTFRPRQYFVALGIALVGFAIFVAWLILLRTRINKTAATSRTDETNELFLGPRSTES